MKKSILFVIMTINLVSCRKTKDRKPFSNEYFSVFTDEKKMTNKKEVKLNDSVFKITGKLDKLRVSGFLNEKRDRIKWWNIINEDDNELDIKIEYKTIDADGKNNVNQYLYYDKKNIVQNNISKYYTKTIKYSSDSIFINYNFYTPSAKIEKYCQAKLIYFIHIGGKTMDNQNVLCKINNGVYSTSLALKKTKEAVGVFGIFSESYQEKPGELSLNEIIIEDVISDFEK